MAFRLTIIALAALCLALGNSPRRAGAQEAPAGPATAPARFFDSDSVLQVTLTADLRQLRRDKQDEAPWRGATLSYAGADGAPVVVPARVRTRGLWRLKNCDFPPLRLDFAGATSRGTAFAGLNRPKLVNFCRDTDAFEQYVLQEFQIYRTYALLTPMSHRARLVRMTYVDSASGKTHATRYAFLIEEPEVVARRVGAKLFEEQGARPEDVEPYTSALVGVFQYLVGNTDWSIWGLHNIELLQKDLNYYPVPYDFDHAGAVDASYALPSPKVPIKRVRERLYRGYCVPPEVYPQVFALFNERKNAIYALYRDALGSRLQPRVVSRTLEYFDAFYRTINDARAAKREIIDACVK